MPVSPVITQAGRLPSDSESPQPTTVALAEAAMTMPVTDSGSTPTQAGTLLASGDSSVADSEPTAGGPRLRLTEPDAEY